jgi:hypothetical protein
MSDETPLDLRSLADVDSPEVVREALRTFRRRLWTRYLWIALAIVLAAVAIVVGNRPSNLREEVERANVRAFPAEAVWRVGGLSIALVEAADLGDSTGLHFIVLPDRDASGSIWVDGSTYAMGWGDYDTYTKIPKEEHGTVEVFVGRSGCLPFCQEQETLTIDFHKLHLPADIWRAET